MKMPTDDYRLVVESLQTETVPYESAARTLNGFDEACRTLFDLAPAGVTLITQQGDMLALNPQLCAMLGLSEAEAGLALLPDLFVNPAEREQFLARLHSREKIEGAKVWLKTKDGTPLLASVNVQEIRQGSGGVLLATIQDITQRNQVEQHSNAWASLSKLFSASSSLQEYLHAVVKLLQQWCDCQCAGIRLLDSDGRLTYAAQCGFSRQFLKRESVLCLQPSGCACARALVDNAVGQELSQTSPLGSFVCNHTSRYVRQIAPGYEAGGNIACLQAQYESVAHIPIRSRQQLLGAIHLTDRRPSRFATGTVALVESLAPLLGDAIRRFTVEHSLQESEARFRSLFECSNAVMLLIEPKTGALVDTNPAAATFYGYSQERLRTMNLKDLALPPRRTLLVQRRRALQDSADCLVCPQRLATGEIRTVEVHSSTIQLQGRRLVFSVIHDVTERKLLEKQILHIAEKERERLGQDLHDEIGGKLAGAALMGKALAQKLVAVHSVADAELAEEVVKCINEAITQSRSIAHGLCPVELGGAKLHSALLEYAVEVQRRFGLCCQVRVDSVVTVEDPFVAAHLFRIVQEAVANALRHGAARTVEILLTQSSSRLSLEIRDDGVGMPAEQQMPLGLGLRTMRYRAELIGAQFEVRSAKPTGTRVLCWLPLSPIRKKRP